jgi:hypothetical protein
MCSFSWLVTGCGESDAAAVSVSAPYETVMETDTAEAPEEDTAAEEDDTPIVIPIETCLSAIESVLETNYGENYRVALEDDMVTVGVWSDGIALCAMAAVSEDTDAMDAWNGVMDAMVTLDESVQGVLEECGHGDVTALVNVVNDMDLDSVLASIEAGEIVYDAVNGVDLVGGAE